MDRILNIPVQMIASCTTSGEFTPLRFRFENRDCTIITVNVDSVVSHSKEVHNSREIVYTCRAPFAGRMHIIDLRYVIQEHKWFLYRLHV